MHARATLDGRVTSAAERFTTQPSCRMEPLEGRRLFAFSTVDALPNADNGVGMTADGFGNVYVAGGFYPTGAPIENIIRQSSDGGSTWTNILSTPSMLWSIAASPSGAVYAGADYGGGWQILERPAGGSQFQRVDSGADRGFASSLSVDAAGKAYAVQVVPVTVTGSGGKTTTTYRAAVTRQDGALGEFVPVDTFGGVTSVFATTQGVYAVGKLAVASGRTTVYHWIVRRSATGDPGTWTTVDDFQLDAANNQSSRASHVTVDANGKVFVGGSGGKRVRTGGTDRKPIYTTTEFSLVRTSADGGASWTTEEVPRTGAIGINAIGADAAGNVYVAGAQQGPGGTLLQMKPAGGGGWVTVDHIDSADYAEAYGITTDSNGNVYFGGFADDYAGYSYGFVRMMPAAAPLAAGTFSSTSISSSTTDHDSLLDSAPDALELLLA